MIPVIVPIVEGHGEESSVPILLRRIIAECAPEVYVHIERPIRGHRGSIGNDDGLRKLLRLASLRAGDSGAVLVLCDADDDCAVELAARLRSVANAWNPTIPVTVVVAQRELEAWFLAGLRSLAGIRGLPLDVVPPSDVENIRDAKGWLGRAGVGGGVYSSTVDQPALAAEVDLLEARGARSFDKLCREVTRMLVQLTST